MMRSSDGVARWEGFARALTDEATVIADRDDLLVTVAPGAGHGAPACFLPATATIELDATHLGELDPDTATPDQDSDRVRYRIGWGLLVHECAHAQHSRWDTCLGTGDGVLRCGQEAERAVGFTSARTRPVRAGRRQGYRPR